MSAASFNMHTYLATLLSCALLVVAAAPAALAGKPKPRPKAPAQQETEPSKRRPHRGMTKAQVRKWYGEPDDIHVTSRGETWSYFFNRGHYFIPYYFGKPRTATFTFNEAGILTDFEYNQED